MFIQAAKVAIVEALKAGYNKSAGYTGLSPAYVGIEYPEVQEQWPAVLVQFHPASIQWIDITSHIYTPNQPTAPTQYTDVRQGKFTGNFDLMVLALTSAERDQLWDRMITLVLFGDSVAPMNQFAVTLNNHDLIPMTFSPTHVTPVGDSVGGGVVWDPEALAYEVTLRVDVVGEFYADVPTQTLAPISGIKLFPYTDQDPVPGMNDGQGAWTPA